MPAWIKVPSFDSLAEEHVEDEDVPSREAMRSLDRTPQKPALHHPGSRGAAVTRLLRQGQLAELQPTAYLDAGIRSDAQEETVDRVLEPRTGPVLKL